MKKKNKATFTCSDCNTKSTVKYDYSSELFELRCPKCNSENIFFNEIEEYDNDDFEIVFGRGGCSQK